MAALVCVAIVATPAAAALSNNASYEVSYLRAPASADAGSTITAKVSVTNVGSSIGSGTVDYRIDADGDGRLEADETVASKNVFLSKNQVETIEFQISLDGYAAGSYKHGAVTANDRVSATIDITADSNDPPVADAGEDVTVSPGAKVTLDGSGSSDPNGDSLSYSWTQTAGTSVTLSGADTASPTFTAPSVDSKTTLSFELTVDDGDATATDTVSVTVDPGSSGDNDGAVRRSLSKPTVPAGGSVNVTLTIEFENAHDGVSVSDDFSGPVSAAHLQEVRVNGEASPGNVLFPDVSKSGVTVALQDIGANATVEVVYTVEIADDASKGAVVEFTGSNETDVVADDFEANFGTDSVTVGTPVDVDRELGSAEVSAGGTLQATLSANLDKAYASLSIQDGFSGPVASAAIDEVRLNGQSIDSSKVVFSTTTDSGVTVALSGLPQGANLTVEYSVTVAESAKAGATLTFSGVDGPDVAGKDLDGEFGTDVATVVEKSGPVARFDADGNGKISTAELNAAIQAWATGDLTTTELNAVIQAWATSG